MDVPSPELRSPYWALGLIAMLIIALALRLHGIHDPILDHPGWRQGDTAAIARNFARLRFDIMYPQTMYNGAPPNYVELELQLVPFLAALLYKLFGIHPVFGRLITVAFSLATMTALAYFARWLFASCVAGLSAAFFYAVFPGSVYYGRTFMPDSAMVFFLTVGLYAGARYLLDDEALSLQRAVLPTVLLSLAYLVKPVSLLALVALIGLLWQRRRLGRVTRPLPIAFVFLLPVLAFAIYDRRIASYAEWHWTSGITRLHVLPALRAALGSIGAFTTKLGYLRVALGMLRDRMLGDISFALAIAGFIVLPWIAARSRTLLWCWLTGALLYVFVVVTVERVDYYMLPLLPLAALVIGGGIAIYVRMVRAVDAAPSARCALLALVPLVAIAALLTSRTPVAAYYLYNKEAYRNAVMLGRRLSPDALVVIGHYGPDVQYYIDRFGWEEDPALWTPFDEESAIRKGARYFISIEDNRLRNNLELCAWLQRFPLLQPNAGWPVYLTDPTNVSSEANEFWQRFRSAERTGSGRAFLDSQHRCELAH